MLRYNGGSTLATVVPKVNLELSAKTLLRHFDVDVTEICIFLFDET